MKYDAEVASGAMTYLLSLNREDLQTYSMEIT
jgi:hypothetical protein